MSICPCEHLSGYQLINTPKNVNGLKNLNICPHKDVDGHILIKSTDLFKYIVLIGFEIFLVLIDRD